MITGSLNLTAFKSVITSVTNKQGEKIEGVFIPIKANLLEKHSNGSVYCNIVAWENKTKNEYSTHGIKQSLKKEVREAMSKEELDSLKFLGNLKVDAGGQSAPQVNTDESLSGSNIPEMPTDDLPF